MKRLVSLLCMSLLAVMLVGCSSGSTSTNQSATIPAEYEDANDDLFWEIDDSDLWVESYVNTAHAADNPDGFIHSNGAVASNVQSAVIWLVFSDSYDAEYTFKLVLNNPFNFRLICDEPITFPANTPTIESCEGYVCAVVDMNGESWGNPDASLDEAKQFGARFTSKPHPSVGWDLSYTGVSGVDVIEGQVKAVDEAEIARQVIGKSGEATEKYIGSWVATYLLGEDRLLIDLETGHAEESSEDPSAAAAAMEELTSINLTLSQDMTYRLSIGEEEDTGQWGATNDAVVIEEGDEFLFLTIDSDGDLRWNIDSGCIVLGKEE